MRLALHVQEFQQKLNLQTSAAVSCDSVRSFVKYVILHFDARQIHYFYILCGIRVNLGIFLCFDFCLFCSSFWTQCILVHSEFCDLIILKEDSSFRVFAVYNNMFWKDKLFSSKMCSGFLNFVRSYLFHFAQGWRIGTRNFIVFVNSCS